jgi:hypothetical protein
MEKRSDRLRVADVGQGALDDYPVETGNDTEDLARMTFAKVSHIEEPPRKRDVRPIWPKMTYAFKQRPTLYGSGLSGLG